MKTKIICVFTYLLSKKFSFKIYGESSNFAKLPFINLKNPGPLCYYELCRQRNSGTSNDNFLEMSGYSIALFLIILYPDILGGNNINGLNAMFGWAFCNFSCIYT